MPGPGIVDEVGSHLFVLILQVFNAGHWVSSHFPPLHSFILIVLVHILAPSLHSGDSSSLLVSAQLLANVERAPNINISVICFLICFLFSLSLSLLCGSTRMVYGISPSQRIVKPHIPT